MTLQKTRRYDSKIHEGVKDETVPVTISKYQTPEEHQVIQGKREGEKRLTNP